MNIGTLKTSFFVSGGHTKISYHDEISEIFKQHIATYLRTNTSNIHITSENIEKAKYIFFNKERFSERIAYILHEYQLQHENQSIIYLSKDNNIYIDLRSNDNYSQDPYILIFNRLINSNMSVIVEFIEDVDILSLREDIYKRDVVYTGIKCKKCFFDTVIQMEIQLRSGDEGGSLKEDCTNCGYSSLKWS